MNHIAMLESRVSRRTPRLHRSNKHAAWDLEFESHPLDRLGGAATLRLERQRHRLSAVSGRLDALSPLRILERGYALVRDAEGRVLKRVAQLAPGLAFRLRVTDGEVAARVTDS